MEDIDAIKDHAIDFFSNLYEEGWGRRPKLDGINCNRLSDHKIHNRELVERSINEEKIKKVSWDLEGDKALGSGGFSLIFYRVNWVMVKAGCDLCRVNAPFL